MQLDMIYLNAVPFLISDLNNCQYKIGQYLWSVKYKQ